VVKHGPFYSYTKDLTHSTCPVTNYDPSMDKVTEHGFVEQLVPHPPVEAFNEPVLHPLPGRRLRSNLPRGGFPGAM